MTWRDAEFEDLFRIVLPNDPIESDMRGNLADTPQTRTLLRDNAQTWEEGGEILAIVGVSPMWKGVGQVWTMLTENARQRGVVLTRGVVGFLSLLHSGGYHRLQATVTRGDETGRLWILRLGFEYEGMMLAYGPDLQSHSLYSRVRA